MRSDRRAEARAGWIFVAPAVGLIALFYLLPVIAGFALSLTDFDLYAIGDPSVVRVVGAANYQRVLTDPEFWAALRHTLFFVFVGGPLSMAASLGAALLLHDKLVRGRSFFRTVYFAPVVTTLVAVALVWRYLYHPTYGLVDHLLGFVGIAPIDWLGDPRTALWAILILAVWKSFGYNMLILIAGLSTIPEDLYEAARLDGAGAWQQFRHITLPSLGPTLLFVGIMTMLAQFQVFAEPYVMTQGGPLRSTVTAMLLMYEQGFRWWRMGYANAIAFVLFALMLVATLIQMRLQKGSER